MDESMIIITFRHPKVEGTYSHVSIYCTREFATLSVDNDNGGIICIHPYHATYLDQSWMYLDKCDAH